MIGFGATLRREFAYLWCTPFAWVLLTTTLTIQGGVFASIVTHFAKDPEPAINVGPLEAFFGQSIFVPLLLLFLCPTLTMRAFAEERRSGTIDQLLAAPVRMVAVVLGKYVAVLATLVIIWIPSTAYPLLMRPVMAVEWYAVGASYLGIFALGAGFLAVGMLCSAMTRSQFTALVLSSAFSLGMILLGIVEYSIDESWLQSLCDYVAIQSQLAEMSQGIIETHRLVFDATLIILPLYCTTQVADSWRWS